MLPPIVKGGLGIGMIVAFIIAINTGSAALAEAKKGTKVSDNPLKGEVISFSVFCAVCLILLCMIMKL